MVSSFLKYDIFLNQKEIFDEFHLCLLQMVLEQICSGNELAVEVLIKHGANMSAETNKKITPFHLAAQNGNLHMGWTVHMSK